MKYYTSVADLARARRRAEREQYVDTLVYQLAALHLPAPVKEFEFHCTRAWRFDLAYPALHIAIECEGGTWSGGRHVRGEGYAEDCRKYNEAQALGWRVYRFTSDQIKNGEAFEFLEMVLRQEA